MKKKALLSSILTIVLCISIIAGSTFALFTSSDEIDVAVTAGNVELTAVYDTASMLTWSLNETEADARKADANGVNHFANDGTAKFDGDTVVIDRMTPGDVAKFKIVVTNSSNVNIQYRIKMISEAVAGAEDLTPALVTTAYVDGYNYIVNDNGAEKVTPWAYIDANEDIDDFWVTVNFPNHDTDGSVDNQYKNRKAKISFVVEAVQGNANVFTYDIHNANDLAGANGVIEEGIYNGEGNTVANLGEGLNFSGYVTLANITVKGETGNTTLHGEDDGLVHTLVLSDGATVTAPMNSAMERAAVYFIFRPHTLIVDKGARLVADGEKSYAIIINDVNFGTAGIVLNDFNLIERKNGGKGIKITGGPSNVNIFVPSVEIRAHYESMIEACPGAAVNWYINGSFAERVEY